MERVLLRSTDEEVGRLVGEVKKKFEEKYHSCEAFREECLTDPNDSQRVVQVIQDGRIVMIVVLDQALHDILDHKKSRRLLNKIRDQFKCGRVVFMKYQIKEGEIQEFIDDVTEEEVCEVRDLCNENIPTICAQMWELPSVNRRATESDEINSRSLDLAAMKLHNEWNTVDKESIEVDNYARNSGSQYRSVNNTISDYHDVLSCDPQESHNSFTSTSSTETGSSLSSSGKDGTMNSTQNTHTHTENVQSLSKKTSTKLRVCISKEDSMKNTEDVRMNMQHTCVPESQTFAEKEKEDQHVSHEIPRPQGSETRGQLTLSNTANITQGQGRLSETTTCQSVQMVFVGQSDMTDLQLLRSRGVNCSFSCSGSQTPEMTNQIAMQSTNSKNIQYLQGEQSPNLPVPVQETCNPTEMMPNQNISVHSESMNRQDFMQSFTTSYHPMYLSTSGIRCQKCNQIKDNVKLYSTPPYPNELASAMSNPMCFSVTNSSGPEAMRFSFSLCLDCSNNDFPTEGQIRQNSFCGTNETFHSSNLFPPNLEHSVVGPTHLEHPVQQMGAVSNLEKGFQTNYAMPRHESSPSRLYMYQLPAHQQGYNNNFSQPQFRQEILTIDQNMRQVPSFHRNIPVNSAGIQHSNPDNTQIRSSNSHPRAFSGIPENLSTTVNKGYKTGSPQPISHLRHQQISRSSPSLNNSHFQTFGGASSETSHKPCSEDSAAAGASAAISDYDHLPLTNLSHIVIEYIQSQMDLFQSPQLNWEKLAHLHGWNFGNIYTIKQKWQRRMIESPFLELIQNSKDFQNYTYGHLKSDLEKIPRKDILEKLREFEEKQELIV